MLRYVWRELVRNPRRSLASLAGVVLGVGLFSGVLFFIDGSSATMTERALQPLALDMQRVLTSPLGGGLRLDERISPNGPLGSGERATITLRVENQGAQSARDVVVSDQPPPPLGYVPGTTTLDGKALSDPPGGSPLAHGLARLGLNVGTVAPGATAVVEYEARPKAAVASVADLRLRGTVSSRESLTPISANAPVQLTLSQLRTRIGQIPGVASADALSFVDLPPGSLHTGATTASGPVRVFAFDQSYVEHYPSIRIAAGALAPDSAALSAEASRSLAADPGSTVKVDLPGASTPLSLPVSGVADVSQAKPLFYSRNSAKLEQFLYVPNAVIVSSATFEQQVVPAYQALSASSGGVLESPPVEEVDALVDRSLLHSDPAAALEQTQAIARSINRIAPGQDYLIDNISNTLEVARADADVGRRMFVFLGLPGVILAAILAAYAGGIMASAQRREQANLRLRGAAPAQLRLLVAYRTLAVAGLGSIFGVVLGFATVLAILGADLLFAAATLDLVRSALIALGAGILTTALALYIPGRRSLAREVAHERAEMTTPRAPRWRRWRLDFALLAIAAVIETLAFRSGAFDANPGSVFTGKSVSLPSHLILAPLIAWIGGLLLAVRIFEALASRAPVPASPRFGAPAAGILSRSLRRRSWAFATGTLSLGLVVAFGVCLSVFTATYDAAKAADARFAIGSDLRVTPSPAGGGPDPAGFASQLQVPGISAVAPVLFKPENSILIGPKNQDVKDLAAIDPASFERTAPVADSSFVDGTAAEAMASLRADPRGLLVDSETADDLLVGVGDRVQVQLARGTKSEATATFRVAGVFDNFPGFPQGINLIARLDYYEAETGVNRADFFLAKTADESPTGHASAVAALRSLPGSGPPLDVESTETALDKDQSSLTALNVRGLVDLDSLFTLLMALAAISIFVFGLLLQRRREYLILLAQGMETRELQAIVLGETALVTACALLAGAAVGAGMGYLLVHVLRPLFTLAPAMSVSAGRIAVLAFLVAGAAVAAALAAMAILGRLKPTEILREQ